MNKKELKFIRHLVNSDTSFEKDKNVIYNLINNYRNLNREEQIEVFSEITQTAIKLDWSRRKLFGLIDKIFFELTKEENISERQFDDIEGYLDALGGNCAWKSVIKLRNDPDDQEELYGYVRSKKWIYNDYYSDNN